MTFQVISERTNTFADEWGARDIPLTRSEAATVKRACQTLGLPLSHKPTGRTVQVILQHCQALSLEKASKASDSVERRHWKRTFAMTRQALGQAQNN